jgi:hypothetical protein
VLYYLGVRAQGAAARQETTTVVLSPLPGGGGAFLSGRF